jgi:hypothetical protein
MPDKSLELSLARVNAGCKKDVSTGVVLKIE